MKKSKPQKLSKWKIISHRGNLNGGVPNKENNPKYVLSSIEKGFETEIDVWFLNNQY